MRTSIALAALVAVAASAQAQQPAAEPPGPRVGEVAPDFELAGATRYGLLDNRVRLSDYLGKVVVLAFFTRARTRG